MHKTPKPDVEAISISLQIHEMANAEQTFLFGSWARGDHHLDSDIKVLVVKEEPQAESWQEDLRQHARDMQKPNRRNRRASTSSA